MGGNSSRTRKVTFENNNPTSVIKVTDEVVNRLKSNEAKLTTAATTGHSASQQQEQQPTVPPGVPQSIFYEPSLTSIQLRQAHIEALKENDTYWDKRIADLQRGHQEMQSIMHEEYLKAIQEVSSSKKKNVSKELQNPCVDKRQSIISCYKKHKNEPMRCASEVNDFITCVDMKRAAIMESKG